MNKTKAPKETKIMKTNKTKHGCKYVLTYLSPDGKWNFPSLFDSGPPKGCRYAMIPIY